jgi:hypothetical protein
MKRENEGRSLLLTNEQEQWLELQRSIASLRAMPRYIPPASPWRARVFEVVTQERFDLLVICIIGANAALMSTHHWGLSPAWEGAISWLNVGFTVLYVLEAAAKIAALGRVYFSVSGGRAAAGL